MKKLIGIVLAVAIGFVATAALADISNVPGIGDVENTALVVVGKLTAQSQIAAQSGIALPTSTVATLPTCNATQADVMRVVTDATTPTYNGVLTGGGAIIVPVFCNGTAWSSH